MANQLAATVQEVDVGNATTTVKVVLGEGQELTAAITPRSGPRPGARRGDQVTVLVTATEVILATD